MKKNLPIILYACLLLMAVSIVFVFVCNYNVSHQAKTLVFDQVEDIPYHRVGLLLGTSPLLRNGHTNYYFKYRIDAAEDLYRAGKISYLLISGDNRQMNYNEPREMRRALLDRGLPDSIIYMDYAGLRTLDSVVRAKEIFGQDSVTVISQRFHNERAIYIARRSGIYAIGFNAKDVNAYAGMKTRMRELLARVKVYIDMLTDKQPRHLGDKIPIP